MLMWGTAVAQMSVTGGSRRSDYGLKGPVKSVKEAHWDTGGGFIGRQSDVFSRTGRMLEETIYYGEGEQEIESLRLCNYNADGSMAGCYSYRRGGEGYAVIDGFSHWIAIYDEKGRLTRKRSFAFEPKRDRYGNEIWTRTHEDVFSPKTNEGDNADGDTVYTFDKKTGLTLTKRWKINELEFQGEATATYAYTASGDTLTVSYDDATGRMPRSVVYDYRYVSSLEKERVQNAKPTTSQEQTGKAISPVIEKKKKASRRGKSPKGSTDRDTLRLERKTVTTLYDSNEHKRGSAPTLSVRTEYYDDSCQLVRLTITETWEGDKREVREWRWTRKELATSRGKDRNKATVTVYQLTDAETSRHTRKELTYEIKDHFTYDRNGDPVSRTRSGKSLTRPATWRFAYGDYDEFGNWTRRTYSGPAEERTTTTESANGNKIDKIIYDGESEETDTRIITYF